MGQDAQMGVLPHQYVGVLPQMQYDVTKIHTKKTLHYRSVVREYK